MWPVSTEPHASAAIGNHLRGLPADVGGPVGHQPPPTFEQVRSRVRRLNLVADDVRQGRLDYIARMVGPLGRPVPESGADGRRRAAVSAAPGLARRARRRGTVVGKGDPARMRRVPFFAFSRVFRVMTFPARCAGRIRRIRAGYLILAGRRQSGPGPDLAERSRHPRCEGECVADDPVRADALLSRGPAAQLNDFTACWRR